MGSPYSPDFPKSTTAAGPRTTNYAAQGRKANIVFSLEMEREEGGGGGLGRHISAAARLRMHSNIFNNTDSNPRLTAYLSYSEPTHHRSESLGTAVAVGGHLPKRVVY